MSTALYRAFDEGGSLLYVGISDAPLGRFKQHGRDKEWWCAVTDISLEHFERRDDALKAEADAIESESPRFNIARTQRAGISDEERARRKAEKERRERAHEEWLASRFNTFGRIACGNCAHQPMYLPKGILIEDQECPQCGCKTLALREQVAA